jgi:hypothetical protein
MFLAPVSSHQLVGSSAIELESKIARKQVLCSVRTFVITRDLGARKMIEQAKVEVLT